MKNTLFLVSLLAIIYSCNQPQSGKSASISVSIDSLKAGIPVFYDIRLKQYNDFVSKLDTSKPESATLAANKFAELFKPTEKELCDSALYIFEKLYASVAAAVNDKVMREPTEGLEYYLQIDKSANIPKPSQKDKALYQSLTANGFKLCMAEGSIYVDVDREFVKTKFAGWVSPTMNTYLEQVRKENKQEYADDGGLAITPTELSDRLAWWDVFNKANPSFLFKEDVSRLKNTYLATILHGMDNTPLLDETSLKINADFEAAYKHILKAYPNTDAVALIKPYYEALSKKDTAKSHSILQDYVNKGYISY
jgi:hypothetical protein